MQQNFAKTIYINEHNKIVLHIFDAILLMA